jgi:hypothetical protein
MLAAFALAAADPVPPTPARDRSVAAAVQVVRNYYAAVSRHDYRTAYRIWHGGQSYSRFRRGYAQTARVTVTPIPPFDAEGAAGSIYAEIGVKVDAVLRSGVHQHFTGSYTLRRVNDVEGSTAAQRRWHIESAHLKPVSPGR